MASCLSDDFEEAGLSSEASCLSDDLPKARLWGEAELEATAAEAAGAMLPRRLPSRNADGGVLALAGVGERATTWAADRSIESG